MARLTGRTHLHECWDLKRCVGAFRVFIPQQPGNGNASRRSTIWDPPDHVQVVHSHLQACAIIVPVDANDWHNIAALPKREAWNDGRNHVVVSLSDFGISASMRKRYLGCALVAQSHSELSNYIQDFDISLPLPPRLYLHGWSNLAPESPRRYWITFRGTTYFKRAEGSQREMLLQLIQSTSVKRPIQVILRCHKVHNEDKLPENRDRCSRYETAAKAGPSYVDLLNTTFALVPAGRQPATIRLGEVMASGAIPIFISGDVRSSSPYVRPFADIVRWDTISFHFSWTQLKWLPLVLSQLSQHEISTMQRGVVSAWQRFLKPSVARKTFYDVLCSRATSRF